MTFNVGPILTLFLSDEELVLAMGAPGPFVFVDGDDLTKTVGTGSGFTVSLKGERL